MLANNLLAPVAIKGYSQKLRTVGRLSGEVMESLVNRSSKVVGQIRRVDFRAQIRPNARFGRVRRTLTDAGSKGKVIPVRNQVGEQSRLKQEGALRERRERESSAEV